MSIVYNAYQNQLPRGGINWTSDTIKLLLVDTVYTPDKDHANVSLISGSNEVSGTGYSRKTLTNIAITQDDATDRAEVNADPVTWTSMTVGNIGGFLIYKEVNAGDDTLNIPIVFVDSGGFPTEVSGGDFAIEFNTEGIIQFKQGT